MSPLLWVGMHPLLLACLMGLSFVAGGVCTVLAIKSTAPERDLLREQGGR